MPKRPRTHQIETESIKRFRSYVPNQWVVRDVTDDYGIDLEVEIFKDEKATNLKFYVQMKSTDDENPRKNRKEQFKVETLDYLCRQEYPVLLVKYISKEDLTLFKWVYGKHKLPKKKEAKSYTVHFPEENILNSESIFKIANEVNKYLIFKNKRFSSPISLKLINSDSSISTSNLLYENGKNSRANKLINFDGNGELGTLIIEGNFVNLELGAEHCTFGFELEDNDKESDLLSKTLLSIGLLLGKLRMDTLATRYIIGNFRHPQFFKEPEFIFDLLFIFYKANCYFELVEIYRWMIEDVKKIEYAKFFSFELYRNYNRSKDLEADLVEKLFLENINYYFHNDRALLGTAHYNIGNFYRSVDKGYLAIKSFNLARKHDQEYEKRSYFWRELGELLYNREFTKTAKAFYQKAISLGDDQNCHAKLADCFFWEGCYSSAMDEYNTYLELERQKQQDKGTYPDPIFVLKKESLGYFLENYKIVDRVRDSLFSTELTYKYKEPTVDQLIEAVSIDLLNSGALFNLGVSSNRSGDIELAMYSFTLSAVFQNNDVEAWKNALFCSMNLKCDVRCALVFAAAFRYIGDSFIDSLFEYADKNMEYTKAEEFKAHMLELRKASSSDDNFEFRMINTDKKLT